MIHPEFSNTNRRAFLKTTGQLLVGFNLIPLVFCTTKGNGIENAGDEVLFMRPTGDSNRVDSWIRLDAEGKVTVLTGKMELGQGIRTALIQIAADELDVDMETVSIINGDTGQTPNESYTAGSASIESSGSSIRKAAASARFYLLKMAANKWNIDRSQLTVEKGILRTENWNNKISYWELLEGKFINEKITEDAPIKQHADHRYVGKPILRDDLIALVKGEAHFVHDLRLPEMVHARVLRSSSYSAKLTEIDQEKTISLPGILKLIVDGNFVAVVAKREYQAVKAWQYLRENTTWESEELSPEKGNLFEAMKNNAEAPEKVEEYKGISEVINSSSQNHEATYLRPYQMHASTGPSCAVAEWKNNKLTVWSPTQGVYPLRSTLADFLKLPEVDIRCIGVPGSGCYGHNGADDVSADAAFIAKSFPGKPVRVQWMREDEHVWEPYGSAMRLTLKAGLDAKGKITGWDCGIWSDTHSTRPRGSAGHFIAARHLEQPFEFKVGGFSGGSYRNSLPLYNIPAKNTLLNNYKGPLRTSALRGLGAYGNIFALESFMDELATLAGEDPIAFRLKHLEDNRAREVLETLAEKTDWGKSAKANNTGLGIAFAQYKNSAAYFAILAEVILDPINKSYLVRKLTGVIDAGQTINPDGLINQTEGGMIQSASWTLMEEVNYSNDGITSRDWSSYPIMRFMDCPEVEVHVINRPELAPMGAGEAAQGPTAAAIANAIFDATGSRVRELPLRAGKIEWDRMSS